MSMKEQVEKMLNNEEFFKPLLDSAFDEHDKDKSGFIEKNELYECLVKLAKEAFKTNPPKKEDADKVMTELDTNKDGKISKEEFRPFVKGVILKLAELGLF